MLLKELLEEPIDSFWNKNFPLKEWKMDYHLLDNLFTQNRQGMTKYYLDVDSVPMEEFNAICKSVLMTPLMEMEFRTKKSEEFKEFKKTININNEESYKKLGKFLNLGHVFSEESVFKLSQFIYYELYFEPTYFYQGRFPSFRILSKEDIRKTLLLNDSLKGGFELKEEDKFTIHQIMSIGYTLGEWGKIDAAEIVFLLIKKVLDMNKILMDDGIVLDNPHNIPMSPIKYSKDYNRYNLSLVHGMGKIYQLQGKYQKSIDLYLNGFDTSFGVKKEINESTYNGYSSEHNRHIEDLIEAYKSSELMEDEFIHDNFVKIEQRIKIRKLIENSFNRLFYGGIIIRYPKDHIAREPSMVSMLIRDRIFKNIT